MTSTVPHESGRQVSVRDRHVVRAIGEAGHAIVATAGSQVGAMGLTSALGFCYWWLAARGFPADAVGLAAACVSAMMLLGNISALGFGTLLMGELSRHHARTRPLIIAALLTTGCAGGVLGTGFALVAPHVTSSFRPLVSSSPVVLLFAAGVAFTAVTVVLDQALLGLLHSRLQFERNAIFATTKLIFLAAIAVTPVAKPGLAIYATWLGGSLASVVWPAWIALRREPRLPSYRPDLRLLAQLGPAALWHHGLNLALQMPPMVLPILVAALMSVRANAYFYTTWMLAGFVFVPPFALATSLYAVGASDPPKLATKARFTLRLAAALAVLCTVVTLAGAPFILRLFGASYAHEAAWTLRILVLGVFPLIVKDHFVAIRRVQGRIEGAALGMVLGSVLEVALACVGAVVAGLAGVAAGWALAVCVEAAFMSGTVYRTVRGGLPTRFPA